MATEPRRKPKQRREPRSRLRHAALPVSSPRLAGGAKRLAPSQPLGFPADAVAWRWLLERSLKALLDRILAVLLTVVLSPLLLVLAIGVKLSSRGPVLFSQCRIGLDGMPIQVLKFRTMCVHEEPPGTLTQAQPRDPRVTRFGWLMRRTSLDELPQLYNVICGDMSLVGPRPHAVFHHEHYRRLIQSYMKRHRVKPGITGWAQVSGWRGPTDTLEKMEKRIEFDLHYIEHWSLLFDLRILWLTLWRGFLDPNAC